MEKGVSLNDLFKEAPILEVENHISLDSYLKSANKLFISAKTHYFESDYPAVSNKQNFSHSSIRTNLSEKKRTYYF